MINRKLGHYRIEEKIGAGGMGEVYRARDERLERDVALKVIVPEMLSGASARRHFRNEALTLSKLNHPNIAVVHDFDSEDGVDFLVMEYINGMSLADKIAAGPLSEKEALQYGIQIASALEEAHERGIIHRDLKPANVFVTAKGQVKVLDFGLAQLFQPDPQLALTAMQTQLPAGAGTLPYMSPEQLRGEALDPRADLFALGAVFYEMATGQRAFPQNQSPMLIDSVLNRPPTSPSQLVPALSPELERITLKCLEKAPADRYQSAREVTVDLRRHTNQQSATASGPVVSVTPAVNRKRTIALALAVVVVLALIAVFNRGRSNTLNTIPAIVALPTKVYGPAEESFLSDAIPSTLSTQLAQVQGLEIKMPPSNTDVQPMGGDLVRLASAFDVKAVITSAVTVDTNRFVLNVQIVEPETRRVLWSGQYDGQRNGYVEIVRQAAEGVRLAMRPASQSVTSSAASTEHSQAELSYQLGVYYGNLFVNNGKLEYFDRAIDALKQSVQLDPGRADAAGRIASLYADKVVAGAAPQDVFPEANAWAEKALKVDPHASRALAVLSNLEVMNPAGSPRKALEYALRAVAANLQDTYAMQRLSGFLARDSYVLASVTSRQVSQVDPLVMVGPVFEALSDSLLGNYDIAASRLDAALTLNPDFPFGLQTKALVLTMADRRSDEVTRALSQLDQLAADKRFQLAWVNFAHAYVDFTRAGKAHDTAALNPLSQRLIAMARGDAPFPRWQTTTLGVAPQLARYGKREEAIALLNHRGTTGVSDPYDVLLFHPDLKPILGNIAPALIASRARFDETIGILQEARVRGELPRFLEQDLKDLLGRIASAGR